MENVEVQRDGSGRETLAAGGSGRGSSAGDPDGGGGRDPLAPWRGRVEVRPVAPGADGHSIHTYFNACPESPDGRRVIYFASGQAEGHVGEIRILDRSAGRETIAARNVTVEDAHRAACQQWVSNGQRVVFHDFRDGEWIVAAVDAETCEQTVLARGRQLAWGQPRSDIVPLYGPHWDPDAFRDLELLNVETGERQTRVTASDVVEAFGEWIGSAFGGSGISIFFPILSPDLSRVMFKLAAPQGSDFRSPKASLRRGLVCCDLNERRFLFRREAWGHPAWRPGSRDIINVPNLLIDSDSGATRAIPGLPRFPGSHPSFSPDGRLFATDALDRPAREQPARRWRVLICDVRGKEFVTIHEAEPNRGATSWRPCDPHPAFSHDGQRLYFNVNGPKWTRLHVAEAQS